MTLMEKRTLTRTFWETENSCKRTDDVVCGTNRGCFSQAELLFTYGETAVRTMAEN